MRLTDADALLAEAMADGAYGYVDAEQIANAPTVDAVPMVHGEWKEAPTAWRCSVCECDAPHTYPHCPNCGAKMDGGKEDEITP